MLIAGGTGELTFPMWFTTDVMNLRQGKFHKSVTLH